MSISNPCCKQVFDKQKKAQRGEPIKRKIVFDNNRNKDHCAMMQEAEREGVLAGMVHKTYYFFLNQCHFCFDLFLFMPKLVYKFKLCLLWSTDTSLEDKMLRVFYM